MGLKNVGDIMKRYTELPIFVASDESQIGNSSPVIPSVARGNASLGDLSSQVPRDDGRAVTQIVSINLSNKTDLQRLFDHFIKENNGDPIAFERWEKIGLLIQIIGASGGIYVYPTAVAWGKGRSLFLAKSVAFSNPASNTLFLANATYALVQSVGVEVKSPPEALKDIVKMPSKSVLRVKHLKMLIGSLICAVPFGINVYLYPFPGCDSKGCLPVSILHAVIANTILHAISWDLILRSENWYYRLPLLPFEKLYRVLTNLCQSDVERALFKIEVRKGAMAKKYKELIKMALMGGVHGIAKRKLLSADEFFSLEELKQEGFSIIDFVKFGQQSITQPLLGQNRQTISQPTFFRKAVGLVGAGLTIMGGAGWVASPIYLSRQQGLSWPASIAISALPTYSTLVLFSFYGSAISQQLYDYLTTWKGGLKNKFSIEARRHPKKFIGFSVINTYMSIFAFACAQQLISTVFAGDDLDVLRSILFNIALPIFILLSFIPLSSLFDTVLKESVARLGREDDEETLLSRLFLTTFLMCQYLEFLSADSLLNSLNDLTEEEQGVLGIDTVELAEDTLKLTDLETKKVSLVETTSNSGSMQRFGLWRDVAASSSSSNQALVSSCSIANQS